MPTPAPQFFQSLRAEFAAQVDAASGIIRRVAVITQGPALGHGVMVDRTTLAQVKTCAESYRGGLKVKINHGSGVDAIVGYLTGFALDGDKLVADLHLLATAPARAYVLELAERIPDTFGLSIAFSGVSEEIGGARYARCSEIYSADLVSEPAANPSGLFSRRFDEWRSHKGASSAPATSTHLMENELLQKIGALVDEKLAAQSAAFKKDIDAVRAEQTAAFGRLDQIAKTAEASADKAALAAVKEFAKTLGQPAGSAAAPSAPPAPPAPAKTFEQLVKEHAKYSTAKAEAVAATVSAHPAAHADYLRRVRGGEVIMF